MTVSTRSAAAPICVATVLLTAVLALSGCGGAPATSSSVRTGYDQAPPTAGTPAGKGGAADLNVSESAIAPAPGTGDIAAPGTVKLVVVNKTLRLEATDVNGTLTRIRELAVRDGGDIANLQVSTSIDQPVYRPLPASEQQSGADSPALRAFVVVRVPVAKFQTFVDDASKLGVVKYQAQSSDDVTQQHVDMKARLGNLAAEQTRLRQLFSRATNVKDMLEIERELTRVQGEIESMQAQISFLERQAAMATVTIELTEPKPLVRPAGIDWGVGAAVTEGVRAFVGTMNVLIVMLGPVLAILLFVALPAFLVVRGLVRRANRRRSARLAASPDDGPQDDGQAGDGADGTAESSD